MPALRPQRLDDHVRADLRFVRDTMARSTEFSALPGWGGLAMGILAIAGAAIAHAQATPNEWLAVWTAVAVLGFAVGVGTLVHKTNRHGVSLARQPARGFALSLLPPLLVGALLSFAWIQAGAYGALPGTWLLLYGTAVLSAGAYSVRIVPLLGGALAGLGAVVLFLPRYGDLGMALGFGGLQVATSVLVIRRHGG